VRHRVDDERLAAVVAIADGVVEDRWVRPVLTWARDVDGRQQRRVEPLVVIAGQAATTRSRALSKSM
jgi:hypothetical protein